MKALILATEPEALLRVCDIPVVKRLLYTLRAAGVHRAIVVLKTQDQKIREAIGEGGKLGMEVDFLPIEEGASPWLKEQLQGRFLLLGGNYVLDERLIERLKEVKELTLCYDSRRKDDTDTLVSVEDGRVKVIGENLVDSDGTCAGVAVCTDEILPTIEDCLNRRYHTCSQWLTQIVNHHKVSSLDISKIASYTADVRRKLDLFWFRVNDENDTERCRDMLLERSQKRTLDVLAWNFNRPIENWIVRHIAHLPITPNQVSIITSLVAYGITFMFFKGYLLPASLLTFLVNVLDGVDGKLARVKGIITKLGHLEHSFDLLYEQSWYIAFAWALFSRMGTILPLAMGFAMVLFDSFSRHCSMQFKEVMGVPLADYAPFDRRFRRFDGRRNIYTIYILGGTILGFPLFALFAMTLHALVTAFVYAIRAYKHLRNADLGRDIT